MTTASIFLAFLPGFAWLFFYLQEATHPEPKKYIAVTFIVGGAFAFFALILEVFINAALRSVGIQTLSTVSLLVLAFIEEMLKFGAAYYSIHDTAAFDEPVEAMIYMVVAAMGFATVENIGALHGGEVGRNVLLASIFETASLRFVGATLLHSLTSAILGYYWAVSIREFQARRFIVWGIAVATVLHGIFNYLILNYGNLAYSLLFVVIVGFFVLNDFETLKHHTV